MTTISQICATTLVMVALLFIRWAIWFNEDLIRAVLTELFRDYEIKEQDDDTG